MLELFVTLDLVNDAALDIGVQVSESLFSILRGNILRSGITGPHGNFMLKFLWKHRTVFNRGFIILLNYQQDQVSNFSTS
jgi:hypothetical protein